MTIFIDMDGVLCDFIDGLGLVFNRPELALDWPEGEYEVIRVLGVSKSKFWSTVNSLGAEFWSNLAPIPTGMALCAELDRRGIPWNILTKPSLDPTCSAGKIRWLQHQFNPRFKNFILCSRKEFLAAPGRVLIDDSEENCAQWERSGGFAVRVPRPWNFATPGPVPILLPSGGFLSWEF